ncbi:MAG: GIY-YIG nuclease family protein [Patescibacteria group bacterium]
MYYVYILECKDRTFYTGITTDVQRRFNDHKSGKGGHYTSSREVVKVLYTEQFKNKSEALKREYKIKNLRRDKKLDLIKK